MLTLNKIALNRGAKWITTWQYQSGEQQTFQLLLNVISWLTLAKGNDGNQWCKPPKWNVNKKFLMMFWTYDNLTGTQFHSCVQWFSFHWSKDFNMHQCRNLEEFPNDINDNRFSFKRTAFRVRETNLDSFRNIWMETKFYL